MATVKSYTDLEQSKKLADVLPTESADMWWNIESDDNEIDRYSDTPSFCPASLSDIPCWSLAALLSLIPKRIKDYNVLRIDINENDTAIWYDEIGCGVNNELPDITMESAVDACYETIVKLNDCMGRVVETTNDAYLLDTEQGIPFSCHSTRLWTIQDAKDGDFLVCGKDKAPFIFKGFDKFHPDCPVAYCGITDRGWFQVCIGDGWWTDEEVFPATKEQRNELEKAMAKYGYIWDSDNKKLKNIEQKSDDKPEPKFKVKYAGSEYNVFETKDIAGVTFYGIEDEPNHIDYVLPHNCEIISEQKPVWSEEDEKEVAVLEAYIRSKDWSDRHIDRALGIVDELVKKLKSLNEQVQPKQEWSEEDEWMLHLIIAGLKKIPSTLSDECIIWLKSIKDRVQPKPAWSEEDEQYLLVCKNALAKYQITDKWDAYIISHWLENKLKSIKPQNRWKPSDEQIEILNMVLTNESMDDNIARILRELREQLKKLK